MPRGRRNVPQQPRVKRGDMVRDPNGVEAKVVDVRYGLPGTYAVGARGKSITLPIIAESLPWDFNLTAPADLQPGELLVEGADEWRSLDQFWPVQSAIASEQTS